jgi:predicted Zn finger-like uncharacterized protein
MALATQCPHCHTTFRVAHDQLKLRAGLVRCGACKQIFNGIENLVPLDESPAAPAPVPVPQEAAPEAEPQAPAESSLPPPLPPPVPKPEPEPDVESEIPFESSPPDEAAAPEEEKPREDPLLRMTLMDFAHARNAPADGGEPDTAAPHEEEQEDAVEQAIDDLQNKPWRSKPEESEQAGMDALDKVDAADYEEPTFVKQARRRQRVGHALHIFMAAASLILLGSLIAQSAYVFRNQIAAWFPQVQPLLVDACARVGCQVGLPAQIDAVSIESSELQALAANGNTFSLTVLLRNHGATPQAWPNIELTLNDTDEKALARRVFIPREYLPSLQEFSKGLAARSEQPIKLYFELSQLKAAGYRVYVFYP